MSKRECRKYNEKERALIDADPFLQELEAIDNQDLEPEQVFAHQIKAILANYERKTGKPLDAAALGRVAVAIFPISKE